MPRPGAGFTSRSSPCARLRPRRPRPAEDPVLKTLLPLLALALALGPLAGCSAQGGAPAMTRDQAEQVLAELKDIKRILAEQQPKAGSADPALPGKVRLDDVAVNVVGDPAAAVTLVEFTDYQCPFCRRFHERTWPELKKKYVDTGLVRFVVRDLPLPFHDEAEPAAIAARCAGQQGRFWAVFESLFTSKEPMSADAARKAALAAGAAAPELDHCIASPAVRQAIAADAAEAERIGVTGTPGFVIAQRRGDKLEGSLVLGAQPTAVFSSRIDALLAAAPSK